MLEASTRIVVGGADLQLSIRHAEVTTLDPSLDLLEKICNVLRRQYSLATVPFFSNRELLLLANEPIRTLDLQGEGWLARVTDTDQPKILNFAQPQQAKFLADLLERALLIEIGRQTDLWTLDSPRIWYEREPFLSLDGIDVYLRFMVSTIPIENVGVGIIVQVSTAFYTQDSIADFFCSALPETERQKSIKRFNFLSRRQQEQKATLMYESETNRNKCYFEKFFPDITCGTTGEISFDGRKYKSLLDYYRQRYAEMSVKADDPVAKVSFPGIDRPCFVAANRLKLRVTTESLSGRLSQADKIVPEKRCVLIEQFWSKLEEHPFGIDLPGVEPSFWQPDEKNIICIKRPNLLFAQGKQISAPQSGWLEEHKDYYRQRLKLLDEVGCLAVPKTLERVLHVRVPIGVGGKAAEQLGEDIAAKLAKWTRKPITHKAETYEDFDRCLTELSGEREPGVVLFVFEDDDPSAYFMVSHSLPQWRIKRITADILSNRFQYLQKANGSQRRWYSFIEMSALDVLQQMDCIPWGLANSLHYDVHLVIDVGHDRRYFALSLLIVQPHQAEAPLQITTIVQAKADIKRETINENILRDAIVELFQKGQRQRKAPLRSVLVLRDGRECGKEIQGIGAAKGKLTQKKLLVKDARVDVVDVHKSTLLGLRLWNRNTKGEIQQVLQGTSLLLDARTVLLVNTGAPTLSQGTAEPILLEARTERINMALVAEDVHAPTHLNWSNPAVAQRLPLELKRTDEDLMTKAAQEIKRVY